MYDRRTKEYAKELELEADKLNYRSTCESDDDRGQDRNRYMRDYARILYSSSFRRLQGKMQLLGIDHTHFHRNRLTHSLEVAQIARTIAEQLEIMPVVSESCSLAHDIGNPPFGHYGEIILNELGKQVGGYEGNAQTFRILHRLEKKSYEYPGVNLTLRTLFGVTKYNQKRADGVHKFLYDDDYKFLQEHLSKNKITHLKSIDAQVMDLSDEIAYAAHDLEDATSFNIVTLGEIVHEFKISEEYKDAYKVFSEIVKKAQYKALKSNRLKTSEEYAVVLRKELTSTIVNKLCRDIGLVKDNGAEQLGYNTLKKLAKGLKKLLFRAILRKRSVQLYEKKGEKVIRGLFSVYTDENYNKDLKLLPPEYRSLVTQYPQKRLVIDYIAGMMDFFAVKEFIQYFGESEYQKAYNNIIPKGVIKKAVITMR
jgi:dGTPase